MVLALVLISEAAGWPFLRQPLERSLARSAAAQVQLQGDVKLHLIWRPRLLVESLHVASDPRFEVPHLLKAGRVALAWRWSDIWRWQRGGPLRLRALGAEVLDAHLVRDADGNANWQLGATEPDPENPAFAGLPRLGSLTVGQGDITWVDALQDVDLAVRLRGSEGETTAAEPRPGYEATLTGRYRALPLDLQVLAGSTLPLLHDADASANAPWVPVRVKGTVASTRVLFDGDAAALLGTPRLQGKVEVAGPSLANVGEPLGLTLPQTPPFDMRGELQQDGGVWHLQTTRAHVGSSQLKGDLRFEQLTQPPRLTGKLTGPKLALADLGPAIGTRGGGATDKGDDKAQAGRVLPQRRFDLPSLKAMDADVQVAIDTLDFGTTAMAPLRNLQTRLKLDAGTLRLEDLSAAVSGGQVKGMTTLDSKADPAKWEARLEFTGIDLAGWLRGLRAGSAEGTAPAATQTAALKRERDQARQGGDQAVQSYLTGALSGSLHLQGQGYSTAEILSTAYGPVRLNLRDGSMSYLTTELMGLDVAQALGALITGDRPLPLRCARFDLFARDGVVKPTLAVVDNEDSTIWITGQVSFVDESLDLHLITRPKDFSLLSLRTPITVTGTLAKPAVGIEPQRLIARALGALALGAVAGPVAAILPLIEQGSEKGADPCNPNLASASPGAQPSPPAPAPPSTPPPAAPVQQGQPAQPDSRN